MTLAERHQILAPIIDSGKKPTTAVVVSAAPDCCLKQAMLERCADLGLPVFPDLGARVAIGLLARA
ncbi:hypothetical protein [Streptomyces sp. NPDC058457]|uniref:hypothetical protein n=1 Tax=Streptomyces sp. NPDC058457 TaxID=3346507 RepID=UPI0036551D5B